MRGLTIGALAMAMALCAAPVARAGPGQDLLTQHAEGGSLADGEVALAALVEARPRDQEARFALGLVQFGRALERLSQGLVRHGVITQFSQQPTIDPKTGELTFPGIEPAANPLGPGEFEAMLAGFVEDLDRSRETLAGVTSSRVKLRLDLADVRFDTDGDGAPDSPRSALWLSFLPGQEAMRAGGDASSFVVAFDQADALWLQGYAHVLASAPDFLLAHDLEPALAATAHALFAGAETQMGAELSAGGGQFSTFADAIAAVHLLNTPVIEPDRRLRVRQRLLAVIDLSRRNLDAIEAERDDDRELFPNPRQTALSPNAAVTAEQLQGWRAALDLGESVLEGERLIPHWRLERGVNLARLLDEGDRFDLVGIVAGYAVLDFVEDGEVVTPEELRAIQQRLGPAALGFAFWAN